MIDYFLNAKEFVKIKVFWHDNSFTITHSEILNC